METYLKEEILMITKRDIKLLIEQALSNLHEAESNLFEASGLIGDTGNRIDLVSVQARLKQTIAKTEDLIYEPEADPVVYAIVDVDNRIVGKYSEVNHI